MKIGCIIAILFLFRCGGVSGQHTNNYTYNDSAWYARDSKKTYTLTPNKNWAKQSATKTYQNQGRNNSTYIALSPDSSFLFFSVFEVGYYLSVGKWTTVHDSCIALNWNKQNSISLCRNEAEYNKIYSYARPTPLPIENWIFIKQDTLLLPIKKSNK